MTPFATRVDPFAILLVYLAEEHEQIRRSRISSALLLRAVTRSCHSASILAPLTSFAIRNRERQRLVALTIPIPSDSQCAEDVFDFYFLVPQAFRGPRANPVVQPPLRVPVDLE